MTTMKTLSAIAMAGATLWALLACRPGPGSEPRSTPAVWDEARALLSGDKPPASDRFLQVSGRLLDRLGPETERRFCQEAIERWPGFAAAHFALGRAYFRTGALTLAAGEAGLASKLVSRDLDPTLASRIDSLRNRTLAMLERR